mmetsp:Transcript_7558/g.16188  ORF Transcript_7558/g.16188 Transcript_7558/m.16188 type:complete len:361 (+) Transcript_7558:3-1085(+)|eukprot:CAMPEP_0171373462 /NCGR_PEP_ID=MMETSP0879-20121228/12786_1 /TAXON_ID=67004 /ORGANISM="Thalassiosira weissflogii, Strain CCMP1336" /LENGTH=360 /DNA_ID=CAMNT_0011882577 /DNA_START=83 /DNA_END=1165 /DNA_ORIENTATION=-
MTKPTAYSSIVAIVFFSVASWLAFHDVGSPIDDAGDLIPRQLRTLENLYSDPKSMTYKKDLKSDELVNLMVKSFHRNTVMINLSLGEAASNSNLIERCYRSARYTGNFEGYYAVLTDAPLERFADLMANDDKFVVLQVKDEDRRDDISEIMAMKFFKTLMPKYVYSHPMLQNVENINYLDFDIVVGRDMNTFFKKLLERKLQDREQLPPGVSSVYFFQEHHDDGRNGGEVLHGGVSFLDRTSERCMELWGEEIVAASHDGIERDQKALTKTYHKSRSGEYSDCVLFGLGRSRDLLFPDESDLKNHKDYTFVHVSNNRAHTIPVEIQEEFFAYVVGMSEEEMNSGLTFTAKDVQLHHSKRN